MIPSIAILAGGLATRLYPLTQKIPKALLDINGKPFIERQLSILSREGITDVVLCVGYLGEQIKEIVGDGRSLGLNVQYSFDGEKLLGTGGALRKALPLLGDIFWVLYGDSYLDISYAPIGDAFRAGGKKGLMTVYENHGKYDTSNVLFREGQIVKYSKNDLSPDMHYIDYGLTLLKSEAFSDIEEDVFELPGLYSRLIERDELMGYEVKERFYEIGSESGLEELRNLLSQ